MPKGIYKRTAKTRKNLSISHMGQTAWNKGMKGYLEAENHYLWKADKAGYASIHDWVRKRLKKPKVCTFCKEKKHLEMASKSHGFKRNLNDWIFLCRSCHRKYDQISQNRDRDLKGRFI